jgi:hypothetical protein
VKADSSAVKKRDSRTGFRHPNRESFLQKISRRGGRGLSKQPSWTPDAGSAFRSIPARYRGLRAVAVLLVVLLHAFSGCDAGRLHRRRYLFRHFGLPDHRHHRARTVVGTVQPALQFYGRRIRRIFPDRCACAVLALGWLWMLPVA